MKRGYNRSMIVVRRSKRRRTGGEGEEAFPDTFPMISTMSYIIDISVEFRAFTLKGRPQIWV